MIEMYLFSIINNLSSVLMLFIIVLLFIGIILIITYSIDGFYEEKEQEVKTWIKRIVIISISLSLLSIFVPSQSQLIKIIGIGGTIDYIQSNETVKQLPDKCIKALDLYLEKTLNKE